VVDQHFRKPERVRISGSRRHLREENIPVDTHEVVLNIELEIPSAARAVDGSLADKRLLSPRRRVYAE
jgi:hypothetical protein